MERGYHMIPEAYGIREFGDYISRDDLLRWVQEKYLRGECTLLEMIRDIPAAKVVPVREHREVSEMLRDAGFE